MTDPAREVLNQAPPLQPVDLLASTWRCAEAVEREGGEWGLDAIRDAGVVAGSAEALEHSRRAERNQPRLRDPRPVRQPRSTRSISTRRGTGCCAARSSARSTACRGATTKPGAHVVRAAMFTLWGNANDGVMCPVSMTYAAVPALRDGAPELAAEWEPRLTQHRLRATARWRGWR